MSDYIAREGLSGPLAQVARRRAPVVITFGEKGDVVDMFGDVRYYAETKAELVELLTDLLDGRVARVETLADIQMPSGRFADVGVVPEGALRHVVLFDVTASVIERREVLQASHETALAERRDRAGLERRLKLSGESRSDGGGLGSGEHLVDVIQMLSWDMRARLYEIQGHAQILYDGDLRSSAEENAVSRIKRASMHLHAFTSACIARLNGEDARGLIESEPVDLRCLIGELSRQFGAAPHLPEVSFDIAPGSDCTDIAVLEYNNVHQVLVCLIACILDATNEQVKIRVRMEEDRLISEIGSGSEEGIDKECAMHNLLSDPRYATSHTLIAALGGRLISLGGQGIAFRLELSPGVVHPKQAAKPLEARPSTVLIATDEQSLRDRIVSQLARLGLVSRECEDFRMLEHDAAGSGIAMIILAGTFSGTDGVALSYRLHARGIRHPMLLLRRTVGLSPSAWLFDGRRTIISSDVDDDVLRTAIEGALHP